VPNEEGATNDTVDLLAKLKDNVSVTILNKAVICVIAFELLIYGYVLLTNVIVLLVAVDFAVLIFP